MTVMNKHAAETDKAISADEAFVQRRREHVEHLADSLCIDLRCALVHLQWRPLSDPSFEAALDAFERAMEIVHVFRPHGGNDDNRK